MLISLHFFVHNCFVAFGIFINITSIYIILWKTPSALKEYSVLLLNTAITELFSITNHFLVDGRLFYSSSIAICISNGPCRLVSDTFCAMLTAVMNVVMVHCTGLVALSFWYRARILSGKPLVGKFKLQFISTSLFLPHIPYILVYFFTMTPREILMEKLMPFHNITDHGLYGFGDATELLPASTLMYLFACGSFVSVYIVWARIRLMRILRERTLNMSVRTRSTHESLTRILTIHAVMPIFVCSGMGSLVTAQLHGYHSVDIEGSILDIAVMPSLVNPVLTLYFVRPYRVFIASVICGVNRSISLVHSGSNYNDKPAPKLSLSQKMQPL